MNPIVKFVIQLAAVFVVIMVEITLERAFPAHDTMIAFSAGMIVGNIWMT